MQIYSKNLFTFTNLTDKDAETVIGWIQDERVFYWWSANRLGEYPIDAKRLNASFLNDGAMHLIFNDGNTPVGHIMLRYQSDDKSEVRFGYIIVDSSYRGKGYGKKMLELALEYATKVLSAKKISLGVFEDNLTAQRCYLSNGFEFTPQEECILIKDEPWRCLYMQYKTI